MSDHQQWEPCPPGEIQGMLTGISRQQRRRALRTMAVGVSVVLLGGLGVYSLTNSPTQLTCAEVQPKLPAYVRGKLPNQERRQIAQHLQGCPHCREQYESMR